RIGGFYVSFGYSLLEHLQAMLEADDRYQQLRSHQRQHQARRDEVARRLYRQLNRARPRLMRLVRDEVIKKRLKQLGATRRRPVLLCRQAAEVVHVLQWRDTKEEWPLATRVIQELADELAGSLSELGQALYDVHYGRKQVESALMIQRREMKRFDREYLHSARTLEAQLNLIGLPTLGDAIRPHVGRMGRPLKHRPVDEYPDLVETALATGLIRRDAGETAAVAGVKASNPRGIDLAISMEGENTRGSQALSAQQRQNTGSSGVSTAAGGQNTRDFASEKVDQHFTELAKDLEKLDHALSEPVTGLEIVDQPLPEREIDLPKLGRRLSERRRNRVSPFRAALEMSPAVIVPKRRGRRPHVAAVRDHGGKRLLGGAPAVAKRGRLRRAASDWWEKLRPAA
ncbi:MAG: hypothetical protein AAF560_34015, partial [Acidobacteriota bacterium]